jgi:hypothetical protein
MLLSWFADAATTATDEGCAEPDTTTAESGSGWLNTFELLRKDSRNLAVTWGLKRYWKLEATF